jgi:predicted nuclease of restriction endonuclease-like (RecB) superfamily
MRFEALIKSIEQTHNILQTEASRAINIFLTVRNWLIGYYIVEFEQKGEDRAKYGKKMLKEISNTLSIKGFSETSLKINRKFYSVYPQFGKAIKAVLETKAIGQSLTDQLDFIGHQLQPIGQSLTDQLAPSSEKIIKRLSFTHIAELIKIDDNLKRSFYEYECMKGNWSVRELRRQIYSLYFERSGLSKDKSRLSELINENAVQIQSKDIINSPFTFEFLNLNTKALVMETDLEQALIDNLQNFLLELGHGFCFEARQKRILIGDEYFFIDLVFYHRILKCHILVELKTAKFKHHYASQLNTYLNYYKAEIQTKDDNPPVGILLCTHKNNTLVQYATTGLDENIFVEKYLVKLPSKAELEQYLKNEMK